MQVFIFTRYESFFLRPRFRGHFCRLYKYQWNRDYFALLYHNFESLLCVALACTWSRSYISFMISWVIHGFDRFLCLKLFIRACLSQISIYANFHLSHDTSSLSWELLRISHEIRSLEKLSISKFFHVTKFQCCDRPLMVWYFQIP